ncbi:MAG: EamA family transporter [Elusimicrobiales bacterium]
MIFLRYAGLVYCAAIWGSTFFAVKDALSSISPAALVAYRFLICAALMFPFALRGGGLRRHIRESAILSFYLALLYVSQTWGLKYTAAATSGFVTGMFVFFTPLILFLFFGRRIERRQWAASLLAVAGLWLLTGGISGFNRGDAVTILAAVCYAAHVILTGEYMRENPDMPALIFHQFWMTGLACLAFSLLCGESMAIASPKGWGWLIFLALFPTLSAFYVQFWAQKTVPADRSSLIFSLEPVFAALFAWTVGGEQSSAVKIAGGALIFSGIIIVEWPARGKSAHDMDLSDGRLGN